MNKSIIEKKNYQITQSSPRSKGGVSRMTKIDLHPCYMQVINMTMNFPYHYITREFDRRLITIVNNQK